MKNFGELKNDVAVLAQRSADSDFMAKIGVWLNLGINFMVDAYDYYVELQETYNFATVDGRENYPLPNNFEKPLRVIDLSNDNTITPISEEEYIDGNVSNIANATEGVPNQYRISGISGTRVQISSTGKTLKVKSSSSSDTGSVIVRINGYVDSDLLIEDYEDVVISASSPTTYVAGTKTFYKITHVSKSADTVGYITIADSDTTILEYLSPVDRVARHKVLKLGLIPDSAYNFRVLYKKMPTRLVDDNDYPFTECDNFLILDSWAWALSQSKESAQYAVTIWQKAQEAFKAILVREAGHMGPEYQHKVVSSWLSSHRM